MKEQLAVSGPGGLQSVAGEETGVVAGKWLMGSTGVVVIKGLGHLDEMALRTRLRLFDWVAAALKEFRPARYLH